MLSIILVQDEFLSVLLPKKTQGSYDTSTVPQQKTIEDERLAVLAVAYHNLGVEFEHLKRVPLYSFSSMRPWKYTTRHWTSPRVIWLRMTPSLTIWLKWLRVHRSSWGAAKEADMSPGRASTRENFLRRRTISTESCLRTLIDWGICPKSGSMWVPASIRHTQLITLPMDM